MIPRRPGGTGLVALKVELESEGREEEKERSSRCFCAVSTFDTSSYGPHRLSYLGRSIQFEFGPGLATEDGSI